LASFFLFIFFNFNLYSKNIESEESWLFQNLEKFSNLKPNEINHFPKSLHDDFSAYYIKEKINLKKYQEAKRHFLLWYPYCESSCFEFAEILIALMKQGVFSKNETQSYLDRFSSRMTYSQNSEIMLYFFSHLSFSDSLPLDELDPYYKLLDSRSSTKLKKDWASFIIQKLSYDGDVPRSKIEDYFDLIRGWNIDFDYQKLGNLSPHADLRDFIFSWGSHKSSENKEAKVVLERWKNQGVADYHYLDYLSLNSKVSSAMGNSQEALESLEEMAVNGGGEDAIYRKAGYLFYLGDIGSAEQEYKRYLARYPKGPRANLSRYHLFRLKVEASEREALSYMMEIDDPELEPNKLYWEYVILNSQESRNILLTRYPFSFFSLYLFQKEEISDSDWWDLVFSNSGSFNFKEDDLTAYEDIIPEVILKEAHFRYLNGERDYSNILRISSLLMSLEKGIEARFYAGLLLNLITQEKFSKESILMIISNFWPMPYRDFFDQDENSLLLYSLAHRESAFQPNAVSSAGAIGLTQVMPSTAVSVLNNLHMDVSAEEARDFLREPSLNLLVGSNYLDSMLDKYDDDVVAALFAYNAGPSRVDSWLERIQDGEYESSIDPLRILTITLSESRIYARSILTNLFMYERLQDYGLE
tara:strand:+ start:12021 stop:13946 length:1926 start_codon:yes stop_codon:yes gene_type:complete